MGLMICVYKKDCEIFQYVLAEKFEDHFLCFECFMWLNILREGWGGGHIVNHRMGTISWEDFFL